ncbi:hypothetical protein N5J43_14895 [Pseudomonas nicosulfuronedens]|uniref:Carbon storage regulator n=1 Tax=Pseudomonas nicosulfuronedens TaxID=2571105 RepID=A0A5R9R7P4_9PSED|nr:hypothetical protein [Pseudomonas nicosulfuronedens]MDH1010278.1 hypothetical protein [Pseudomonas nicosulfuronedens]MDH1980241.1 hypothetical protein [Pseudomonas nicosulfuronedens]MDH2025513.1 hypothetical protein [Pseudomonas nicosulfuronedens]TLX78915.1 hypothetical protein FAS41_10300 [Pseudomonas nicosulfuronedens]
MQQVEQVLVLEIGDCLRLEDGTVICVQRVRGDQVRLKILEAGESPLERRGAWWRWLLPRAMRSV